MIIKNNYVNLQSIFGSKNRKIIQNEKRYTSIRLQNGSV